MGKRRQIIITLVNKNDEVCGHAEKIEVHKKGLLHRAFSILVFNSSGEMLIHQRAFSKYHSPGLWTNACCGHPGQGEDLADAAYRRLGEEMGFRCKLEHKFTFHYRAEFENGLIENEIDHVFYAYFDGDFKVNPEEVAAYRWVSMPEIEKEAKKFPNKFTIWFKEILTRIPK